MAILTVAMLTVPYSLRLYLLWQVRLLPPSLPSILTVAILTVAILTVAILTVALFTVAILTMAMLTAANTHCGSTHYGRRGCCSPC